MQTSNRIPVALPTRRALLGCAMAVLWFVIAGSGETLAGDDVDGGVKRAVENALTLLSKASAGSAEQRTCFTCHSQAMPVLAMVDAKRRGFTIEEANLMRQVRHTAEHLKRGRKDYLAGRGQGGKSDTAGYALWTLQSGDYHDNATTAPVVAWLLDQQLDSGQWKRSSDRPPSEASDFTTTYVALRALVEFAEPEHRSRVAQQIDAARHWLTNAAAVDTEDRVFRLLALHLVSASPEALAAATEELCNAQRCDGGWAQTSSMDSDAYATGAAMFALGQTGALTASDPAYRSGVRYLLERQHEDGSWHVTSRSRPFQAYYETGFPHGRDQFISTSATAWAVLAMLLAYPQHAVQND